MRLALITNSLVSDFWLVDNRDYDPDFGFFWRWAFLAFEDYEIVVGCFIDFDSRQFGINGESLVPYYAAPETGPAAWSVFIPDLSADMAPEEAFQHIVEHCPDDVEDEMLSAALQVLRKCVGHMEPAPREDIERAVARRLGRVA